MQMPSKVPEEKTAYYAALMAHILAEPRDLYEFKDSVIYPENSRIVRTVLQRNTVSKPFKKRSKEAEAGGSL